MCNILASTSESTTTATPRRTSSSMLMCVLLLSHSMAALSLWQGKSSVVREYKVIIKVKCIRAHCHLKS
jgi:hypothetical protein